MEDDHLRALLASWAADVRADRARSVRDAEGWERQVAADEASCTGLLLDLADRGWPAAVTTTAGRTSAGRIESVGRDFLAVVPDGRPTVLIGLRWVATVQIDLPAGTVGTPGSRTIDERAPGIADVLDDLVERRPRLRCFLGTGTTAVTGTLLSVGFDVLTLATGPTGDRTAFLRTGEIAELDVVR